ncbi:hypothetical protein NDR87_35900 [Nocardia sp. CDC159]|uniref:Uncharacterized protein n=1 Tax=Nocardia pulmonis TaxID=2951408 RepID=A0A9X2EDF6_9NOCA|nr:MULTISPECIES: hypothetical protein [Nocardia]MCM6778872.1 hypothetical protein [Nocardia pulmonis]MCM6791761.1 hypothetical protein [Nocardia sp. CDC159]
MKPLSPLAFRVFSVVCGFLIVICLLTPMLVNGAGFSGIIGWALAGGLLAVWIASAVSVWRGGR